MKTVLITGANQGIGFETAKQLAQTGYYVYLGSRDKKKGLDAIKELNNLGITNLEFIELDVCNIDSIQKAKQTLETKIVALDILINNAGIAGDLPQNIAACKMDNLRKIFETNFFGVIQTTQQFIPLLKKSKTPTIVNVSSELGSLTVHNNTQNANYRLYDAYSCSKTALNAFTVMLANELKDANFRINSVTPGYTATHLNNYSGTKSVAEGASIIVKCAILGDDAPTAGFIGHEGPISW